MKILKETKYLKFVLHAKKPGMKSYVVEVISVHYFNTLGYIKWFGRWRQYCFFPCGDTVWNRDCLKDVMEVLNTITLRHGDEKLQKEIKESKKVKKNK